MSLPPHVSNRLRRLQGEPEADDTGKQSREFISRCIAEGLDDDQIIMAARDHKPSTITEYGFMDDQMLEMRIKRLRADPDRASGLVDSPDFVDWQRAYSTTPSEVSWCLPGLIEQGSSVSLVGPAKVGKSLLALEAAACMSSGRSFLGQSLQSESVLYLDWENRPDVVVRRLLAMGFSAAELEQLRYECLPHMDALDTQPGAGAVLRRVETTGSKLVIIDALQRVLSSEENSSFGIREMYRHLYLPLRGLGVTVLRLDHTGKVPSQGARGSSAKVDDVDTAFQLTGKGDGNLALQRTHSRSGQGWTGLDLRRDPVTLTHEVIREATDAVETEALSAEELLVTLDDLDVPLGVGRPRAAKALGAAKVPFRTEVLAEAIRLRKKRSS